MKLIKPSFEILQPTNTLKAIERAARVCYKSEDKITEDDSSAIALVKNLVERKHYAMLEFGNDIVLSLNVPEILSLFFLLNNKPFLKAIDFQYREEYSETTVIINPRTALEIINFIENDIDSNDKLYFSNKLYYTLINWLPDVIIGNRCSQRLFVEEYPKHSLPVYTGDLGKKAKITVKFICSRSISHELVRHRICSFAQKSSRYCDEKDNIEFIEPPWLNFNLDTDPVTIFNMELSYIESAYKSLRKLGWKPEQAREILPNALKTEIMVKATIEEWEHIFELRCDKAAHPQMRELICPLKDKFEKNGWLI